MNTNKNGSGITAKSHFCAASKTIVYSSTIIVKAILLIVYKYKREFLHYVHVGDNCQLCEKNSETNFLYYFCNSKNAIHNFISFVVYT